MEIKEILSRIDHTQLKPYCTWGDIDKLCREAIKLKVASVCIPQSYIKRVSEKYGTKLKIATVIGFPNGYNSTESKIEEVRESIYQGADEIDMVVNIGDVKNGDYKKVEDEIRKIKEICGNKILKIIVENCYLSDDEKIKMCEIVTSSGADFIKTSTGFGSSGANFEDIKLFKEHIGTDVKIKAAGGIRSLADIEKYIELGCHRIGTSSAMAIVDEYEKREI